MEPQPALAACPVGCRWQLSAWLWHHTGFGNNLASLCTTSVVFLSLPNLSGPQFLLLKPGHDHCAISMIGMLMESPRGEEHAVLALGDHWLCFTWFY